MPWSYRRTIWLVMLTGWVFLGLNRMILSPCLVLIMEEFKLTYAQAGMLFSAYFYSYLVMQVPGGFLGDKIGRKRIIEVGTAGWAVSSFLVGLSTLVSQIFILRFLTGLGQGTYFGNDRSLVATYTPKKSMGFGQSLSMTGMGLGLALGMIIGGFLAENFGWRMAFILMSSLGFLFILIISKSVKEPPPSTQQLRTSRGMLFKNFNMWILSLTHLLLLYAYWLLVTWMPIIFLETGVKSLFTASAYAALIGFSCPPGAMLIGALLDYRISKGRERKLFTSLIFGAIAFFMWLLVFEIVGSAPYWLLGSTLFIVAFLIWGVFACLYTILPEIIPNDIQGTGFGFFNAIGFIGATVAPWITGWLRDETGSFITGLWLAIALLMIGCALILFIKIPSRCETINS